MTFYLVNVYSFLVYFLIYLKNILYNSNILIMIVEYYFQFYECFVIRISQNWLLHSDFLIYKLCGR